MTPTFIGLLVLGAIALIPAVDAIRRWSGLSARREISPQPLEVAPSFAETVRTELRRLDEHHTARTSDLRAEIREDLSTLNHNLAVGLQEIARDSESRSSKIHGRIDGLSQNLFALKGALDTHLREEAVPR